MATTPQEPCDMKGERRGVRTASLALGVAATATTSTSRSRDDDHGPHAAFAFTSVGLAVVYTYTSDEQLGAGDFLGLELSVAVGADLIGPVVAFLVDGWRQKPSRW